MVGTVGDGLTRSKDFSTGSGTLDMDDRCGREGGEIWKVIPTTGYRNIQVSYDLRVNALGGSYTGPGWGTCPVDHNLIDEQVTVFYSTDGGNSWQEAEWLKRNDLQVSSVSPAGTFALTPLGVNGASIKSVLLDGLYVTVWGLVKPGSVTGSGFVVTDGSGDTGVRVVTEGAPGVAEGQYVTVLGAAGFESGRVVRARRIWPISM